MTVFLNPSSMMAEDNALNHLVLVVHSAVRAVDVNAQSQVQSAVADADSGLKRKHCWIPLAIATTQLALRGRGSGMARRCHTERRQ